MPSVRMLGTYGVPPSYGGFESAVANVGGFLLQSGWRVTVYCQVLGAGPITVDELNGFRRVLIPESMDGIAGRLRYDVRSVRHAVTNAVDGEVCLTFGYNSGVLAVGQFFRRIPHVINMDGMEWQRRRHGLFKQAALRGNEYVAGLLAKRLIADHPVIEQYLSRSYGQRRVRMIPYGADAVTSAPIGPLLPFGLRPGAYATVICRPIAENSIVEIVSAWSRRQRNRKLVILGDYRPSDPYHRRVMEAASAEVVFVGPIFDADAVASLRFHCALYLHGHTVGGTNPSLVEAIAAGNPVIAKDNAYNRWVAEGAARYFNGVDDLDALLSESLPDDSLLNSLADSARRRHAQRFTTETVGSEYEELLKECL